VSEEGGDGKGAGSEAPSLMSYTLRYVRALGWNFFFPRIIFLKSFLFSFLFSGLTSFTREVDVRENDVKKIENPAHPYDFVQVWGTVGGGSEPKKSNAHAKKKKFMSQSTVQHAGNPSTILSSGMSVRDVGSKCIPRFFVPSLPRS
jgi:hypothetical protein